MSDNVSSILLVDDDRDICHNMADILTDLGYHVDVANDGRAALELVRGRAYDIALLDLRMPGMDGLTLYRAIKKLQPAIVALLVTAYASGATTDDAVSAGVWRVLPKPVDVRRLMGLIDEAVGQPLVLVVDDDDDLCGNLWDLLRAHGYRVCLAHDGREAAQKLRNSTRVVLLDLKLPDRDGTEVYRELRKLNPEARIVVITGHRAESEPAIDLLRADGVDAVCYKPFDIPSLLGMVAQLAEA